MCIRDSPDSEYLLFGDRALIEPVLANHPALKAVSKIIHTDVAVSMHDKPSQALRRGRKTSSMWLAIDAVKKGAVSYTHLRLQRRVIGERGLDQRPIAEQQILAVGMPGERYRGAGNDHRCAEIATHGVKRDSNLVRHERPGNLISCGLKALRPRAGNRRG